LAGKANVTINTFGAVKLSNTGGGQARIGSENGVGGSSILIHSDQDNCSPLCDQFRGILLDGKLRVGTSDTIQLTSDVSDISQTAGIGAVNGGTLLAGAYGSILMDGANQIASVALNSSAGSISYRSVAPTTNIAASAFSTINLIADPLSLALPGPGNLALGLVSAGGSVSIAADGAILDNNGTATNIATSGLVQISSSTGGSSVGTLAVSADVDGASSIIVDVPATATYGGIRINHTNVPTSATAITLSDNSLLGGQFVDYTTNASVDATRYSQLLLVSNLTPVGLFTTGSIDLSTPLAGFTVVSSNSNVGIQAGGNMILAGGSIFGAGNVVASAGGLLDISTSLVAGTVASVSGGSVNIGSTGTLAGTAGVAINTPGALTVSGTVSSAGGAAVIAAASVSMQAGSSIGGATGVSVSSVGDVALSGASITGGLATSPGDVLVTSTAGAITLDNGASIVGDNANSTVKLSAATNISLSNGSGIVSGNDVYLSLQGSTAALMLNGSSFVLADKLSTPGQTIYLDFLGRSSGGIVIDGVETSSWSVGGSGLFTGNLSTIATLGFGLVTNYVGGVDPVASAIGTIFDTGTRDTESINNIETEEVQQLAAEIAEEEESGEEQDNNATPSEGNEDGSGKSKPAQCT
ncbi:MAG TPA: hypothetical protein VFH22_08980, partial [Rhodocyclaceae bacterium]|nr:hypothetical protein [Rhodocyclaceae bacterium]